MPRIKKEGRMIIPQPLRQQIYNEYNGTCAHCGRKLYEQGNYTIDHIIPLSKGGHTSVENLAPLCFTCNKNKQDDVIDPVTYYIYANKQQKQQMAELFARYLKHNDWLSKNNLFKTDQFTLRSAAILTSPYEKAKRLPTTLQIKKIRPKEIISYLTEYKKKLQPEIQEIIFTDEDQIDAPFYTVTNKNKVIFLFSASIDTVKEIDIILLDIFIHPRLKNKTGITGPTLFRFIHSIIQEIEQTLIWGDNAGSIDIMLRFPATDALGVLVKNTFLEQMPKQWHELHVERKIENSEKRITTVNCIQGKIFAGDYKQFIQDMKKHNCEHDYELMDYYDREGQKENSITQRLQKNPALPAYHRPKVTTEIKVT